MPIYFFLLFHLFHLSLFSYDLEIVNEDSYWINTDHSSDPVLLVRKLKKSPQNTSLLLQVIHKYLRLKRFKKAKHYLDMAKSRQINSHYLLLLEGIYLNQHKVLQTKARKILYKALLRSAQTESIYYIEYLKCLYQENRLKKGLYWNRLALKLFPRNLALLQMYARFWYLSGHYKEAETTLLRINEYNGELPSINFNLSLIYAQLKQHDACIHYLKLASYTGFYKKDLLTLNKHYDFLHQHPQFLLSLDKVLLNYLDFQDKYRFKKI
ncbi:hypothetical protein MJH12_15810 [bacterium]|nr:hypothetical protein [bacterium]